MPDLYDIISIAQEAFTPDKFINYVHNEISQITTKNPLYKLEFFVCEIDNKIISYAGIGRSMYATDSFDLRLGATLPEYQKKGCLKLLISKRLEHALNKLEGRKGIVHVSTKLPNVYEIYGFKTIFINSSGNYHMVCII